MAASIKVRRAGQIVGVAAAIAIAVNTDGPREVSGMATGASEAETFRTDFLRSLARRGPRGVKPVISHPHVGLKAAVNRGWVPHPGAWRARHAQRAGPRWQGARAKIHSTNPLGQLDGGIKRRTDVVGIFSNEAAVTAWSAHSARAE